MNKWSLQRVELGGARTRPRRKWRERPLEVRKWRWERDRSPSGPGYEGGETWDLCCKERMWLLSL